jgi:4-aminobutyrate--pyruvate transaminase
MKLVPDMIICAKALSSAYLPISALMVNQRVFDAVARQGDEAGVFGLTLTYSGHPVSAALARETIRIYEEMDVTVRVRHLTPKFQDGLRKLADHPLVGEVRGQGLIAGVELVRDKPTRAPFDRAMAVGRRCRDHAEQRGLLVRAIGDTITLCPPLVISEAEIDELLARLKQALDDTMAELDISAAPALVRQ